MGKRYTLTLTSLPKPRADIMSICLVDKTEKKVSNSTLDKVAKSELINGYIEKYGEELEIIDNCK